jgi:O-antigen ligase
MILLNEVIDTQKDLERFVDFLAILGIVLASVTATSLYTGVIKQKWELGHDLSFVAAVWMHGERRPSGFAHSAESSSALVFYIFMIMASFARAGWLKRIFLFVTGLLVLSMMLLIGAKAAIGGLLVGTALIILALPSLQKHAIRNGITALVLLVAVYGIQCLCISIGNNLTDNSDVAEYSFSVRVGYWKTAFAYVKHRWIGTGTGGLAPVLDPAVNIHSMYFCVLCELGIIGLLIFVSFLVGGLRRIFRAYARCGNERLRMILCCAAAGIVSICIHALVDVFQEQLYFWLVVSLVCIVCRLCVKSGETAETALAGGPGPSPHDQDSETLV